MTELELEDIFNRHQLKPVLREYVEQLPAFVELAQDTTVDPEDYKLVVEVFINVLIYKKVNISMLLGLLHVENTVRDKSIIASVNFLNDEGLTKTLSNEYTFSILLLHQIPAELQLKLDKYCFPLPLVEKPLPVDTFCNGYHDPRVNTDGVMLNHYNWEFTTNLDVIDLLNSTKLRLNREIIANYETKWRNESKVTKPTLDRFNKATKELAKELPDEIYLTSKFDFRGRVYYQGYHFNPQGCDYNRFCVEFAEGEIVEDN